MSDKLTFVADEDEAPKDEAPEAAPRRKARLAVVNAEPKHEAPGALKRVKVLGNFRVVHDGIVYSHDAVAEVPAAIADEWVRNSWAEASA